ncbi:MAG: hypothetical protein WC956_03485 [bacterium]
MLAAGIPQDDKGQLSSLAQSQQSIQKWVELVQQGAPAEQIKQAEVQVAEALKQHPFEVAQQLPFFQKLVKQFDAVMAFQQFRLPGKDRVIVDNRERFQGEPAEKAAKDAVKDAAKDAAKKDTAKSTKEAAADLQLKEGKLVAAKDKAFANYLAARDKLGGGAEHKAAAERVEQMLNAFERMVVARFEQGKQVAHDSPDGKPHFLPKTDAEWKQFFKAFLDRTVQKKVLFDEIRDFLMRGVISKGNKGIFIGDIRLNDGRIEKFIRFSVLAEALAKLKAMVPGDALTAGMMGELAGEDLMYLALAASRGRDFIASMLPSQGKFMGEAAEARAAEALGIPLDRQLAQKAKNLRARHGGGGMGGLFERDAAPEDLPYQFIPWWSWGNLTRPGPTRWITRVFYGALLVISIMGIIAVTLRILKGV